METLTQDVRVCHWYLYHNAPVELAEENNIAVTKISPNDLLSVL